MSTAMDLEKRPSIVGVASGSFSSDSPSESSLVVDSQAEKRLTRKLDFQLLPICYILCLVNFLDKINIGNARIQGLEKELKMDPKSSQFNIALSVFLITYIVGEVPSNILLKNMNPSTYLSGVTVLFGIVCMCQGFVHNFAGLVVCRFFLGLLGGANVPGTIYLISMYYQRWQLQRRWAIIWTNGFLAGAFGGFLAFALAKLDGVQNLSGWRWIFIVEGLIAVVVGFIAKFFLWDWPSDTKRLTPDEKLLLQSRTKHDTEAARMDTLDRKAIIRIATDWKIYVGALLYFSITISNASLAFFMPTILREFGYSPSKSQVYTIPVWMTSLVVTICVGYLSDRLRRRAIFVFAGCIVTAVGYIMLLCQGTPIPPKMGGGSSNLSTEAKYGAVFIAAAGIFTIAPVTVVWLLTNLSGHYKRGIGMSVQIGLGNAGSIVASNIFLTREAPRFQTGYGVALAFIGLEAVLAALFVVGLSRENKKREKGDRNSRFELPKGERENLGDDHPDFRFCY